MPQLNLTSRLASIPLILLVLIVLALQGCFHGDDDPVPDANPAGYYTKKDTVTVSDGGSSTIAIDDLQAIVHESRIMMMSVSKELLYDGTITSIDGNDYTAEFTIYKDAVFDSTATAAGQITTGASITGTLSGSGFGDGEFSLLYDSANNEVASIARIENTTNATWGAKIGGNAAIADFEFIIGSEADVIDDVNNTSGLFHACIIAPGSTAFSMADTIFYEAYFLIRCPGFVAPEGDYSGLITMRTDATVDDTLVLMMNNGTYSFSGDFK